MKEYRKSEKKNEDNALFVKPYKDIIKTVLKSTKGCTKSEPVMWMFTKNLHKVYTER